ncbi:MAG: HAMP domain-containing sensor histidine kinase, partial [Deltaproteobacteria bacterium]
PDALRAATRDALAMQGGDDGVSPAWIDGLLARLEHAERDAASVRIAGGIGHELNNSLTIYLAVISLLREGIVPEEDELRALQRVGDHLRMQGAQLSRLGARPPECTTVIDLRDALSETVAVLGTAGRLRHLRVDLEAGDQALPVLADRRRIEQMLLSVFLFATASIAEARRLHGEIRAYARCDDDGDVCVTVADNGTGVGTDVINGRDARPNEQAREVGMLIVQQIAMSAGGSVRVERNEGTGSRLSFRFPRATQQAAASSA